MRRLIALALIVVCGGYGAHAATPAEVLCASYKNALAKETNPAKREAMIRSLPRSCEVKAPPARKLAEPAKAPIKAVPGPVPAKSLQAKPAPAPSPRQEPTPPPVASPSPATVLGNGMTIEQANAQGNKAYQSRKYADAMRLFRMSAEAGDPTAEDDIGDMYFQGHGVAVDYGQAMAWYRRAAAKGNAGAEEGIGALYARGQGVPMDYGEAIKWFRRAAAQGNADAANWLGSFYASGHGVAQDPAEAQRWYAKARADGPRR
jgi:TPR repeat protein